MKKRLFTLMLTLVLALSSLSLVACGGDGSNSDGSTPFYVTYYPGGYGDTWLEDYIVDFIAERKYDGDKSKVVKGKSKTAHADYYMYADADVGAITNALNSKKNCPDLVISNGISQEDISNGLIAPLNDVYNSEVKKLNGESIKIKDYIDPTVMAQKTRSLTVGGKDKFQWALPWTEIPMSIAYNETLLKTINHTTVGEVGDCVENGKWVKAPTTVQEFATCLADCTAQGVSGFAWAGKDGSLWIESLIYTWWSQYSGIDDFYDFWNFTSEEQYKNDGIVKAFQTIKDLFYDERGEYKNCYVTATTRNPESLTIKGIQTDFAQGKIVFCLTGDFFANEFASILNANKDKVDPKIMRVPALDSSHLEEKNTYITTDAAMYVPAKAKNLQMAKDFLVYINSEEKLVEFTEKTGGIRPFQTGDIRELSKKTDWSNFTDSIFDLVYGASDYLIAYPKNYKKTGKDEPSVIYTYAGNQHLYIGQGAYLTYMVELHDKSASDVVKGDDISRNLYGQAKEAFRGYKISYSQFL